MSASTTPSSNSVKDEPVVPITDSLPPHDANAESRDLEKQDTAHSVAASGAQARVTRTQSLTRRSTKGRFTHPLSHVKTSDANIVDFDGPDDPYRPMNWPFRKKFITTILYGLTTMGSTWNSAIFSPATSDVAKHFHVGNEVAVLATTFLLLGFGLGPLLWAPLSEIYGRKPAVLLPYFVSACFTFGVGAAKDIQTVLICRFFSGIFGSAPVTNTGGVLGDLWKPQQRGTFLVIYAFAVVGGPTLGPIAGGAIVQSYLGWRWTEYLTGIMQMASLVADVLVVDETYPPALLVRKAQKLRHDTGNWALHARHEEWDVGVKEMAIKWGSRPFQLLMTPICLAMATYAAFVYGIVYLMLSAIPIQFAGVRGWGPVTSELPFLGLLLGVVCGGFANIFNNKFYIKKFKANGNKPVPEARLPPMMIGSAFFVGGMFIFGWTSYKRIFWIAPVIGTVMMGFGFFTIFQVR